MLFRSHIALASVAFVLSITAIANSQSPQIRSYLEADIWAAITARDAYVRSVADALKLDVANLTKSENIAAVTAYLNKKREIKEPWQCYLIGLVSPQNSQPSLAGYRCAISLARQSPAVLFVLYNEMLRLGHPALADTALATLERQLLATGGESVPVVSQQLMHAAVDAQRKGDTERATRLWDWAGSFDTHTTWPGLWKFHGSFPGSMNDAEAGLSQVVLRVRDSWQTQNSLLHFLIKWLFRALQALVVGVFIAMFLKYFTHAIHPVAEHFPSSVPMLLRTMLVGSMVLSLLAFGLIAFIWVLAFILWPYMRPRERFIAGLCLMSIALSPAGAFLEATMRVTRAPDNAPALYTRAAREPFSPALHAALRARATANPGEHLASVALAVSYLKADSLEQARTASAHALGQLPDDPVALMVNGICDYRLGNQKAARTTFERCTQTHPSFAPAYFNLGKAQLAAMETLKGADLITQATSLDPRLVEKLIKKNDALFGQNWPWLRHFIVGDYPPAFYWRNIFKTYLGTWQDASRLWGVAFLGLPPLFSLIAFLVLLVVLLIREGTVHAANRSRVKKVFTCELCHAAMCKRCAKGPYCQSCYGKLSAVQVEGPRHALKIKLHAGSKKREAWLASLLDVLYPGSGMLSESSVEHRSVEVFIIVSALLYGAVVAIASTTHAYPLWVSDDLYRPLFVVAGAYVLAFLVRGIIKSQRAATKEGI